MTHEDSATRYMLSWMLSSPENGTSFGSMATVYLQTPLSQEFSRKWLGTISVPIWEGPGHTLKLALFSLTLSTMTFPGLNLDIGSSTIKGSFSDYPTGSTASRSILQELDYRLGTLRQKLKGWWTYSLVHP